MAPVSKSNFHPSTTHYNLFHSIGHFHKDRALSDPAWLPIQRCPAPDCRAFITNCACGYVYLKQSGGIPTLFEGGGWPGRKADCGECCDACKRCFQVKDEERKHVRWRAYLGNARACAAHAHSRDTLKREADNIDRLYKAIQIFHRLLHNRDDIDKIYNDPARPLFLKFAQQHDQSILRGLPAPDTKLWLQEYFSDADESKTQRRPRASGASASAASTSKGAVVSPPKTGGMEGTTVSAEGSGSRSGSGAGVPGVATASAGLPGSAGGVSAVGGLSGDSGTSQSPGDIPLPLSAGSITHPDSGDGHRRSSASFTTPASNTSFLPPQSHPQGLPAGPSGYGFSPHDGYVGLPHGLSGGTPAVAAQGVGLTQASEGERYTLYGSGEQDGSPTTRIRDHGGQQGNAFPQHSPVQTHATQAMPNYPFAFNAFPSPSAGYGYMPPPSISPEFQAGSYGPLYPMNAQFQQQQPPQGQAPPPSSFNPPTHTHSDQHRHTSDPPPPPPPDYRPQIRVSEHALPGTLDLEPTSRITLKRCAPYSIESRVPGSGTGAGTRGGRGWSPGSGSGTGPASGEGEGEGEVSSRRRLSRGAGGESSGGSEAEDAEAGGKVGASGGDVDDKIRAQVTSLGQDATPQDPSALGDSAAIWDYWQILAANGGQWPFMFNDPNVPNALAPNTVNQSPATQVAPLAPAPAPAPQPAPAPVGLLSPPTVARPNSPAPGGRPVANTYRPGVTDSMGGAPLGNVGGIGSASGGPVGPGGADGASGVGSPLSWETMMAYAQFVQRHVVADYPAPPPANHQQQHSHAFPAPAPGSNFSPTSYMPFTPQTGNAGPPVAAYSGFVSGAGPGQGRQQGRSDVAWEDVMQFAQAARGDDGGSGYVGPPALGQTRSQALGQNVQNVQGVQGVQGVRGAQNVQSQAASQMAAFGLPTRRALPAAVAPTTNTLAQDIDALAESMMNLQCHPGFMGENPEWQKSVYKTLYKYHSDFRGQLSIYATQEDVVAILNVLPGHLFKNPREILPAYTHGLSIGSIALKTGYIPPDFNPDQINRFTPPSSTRRMRYPHILQLDFDQFTFNDENGNEVVPWKMHGRWMHDMYCWFIAEVWDGVGIPERMTAFIESQVRLALSMHIHGDSKTSAMVHHTLVREAAPLFASYDRMIAGVVANLMITAEQACVRAYKRGDWDGLVERRDVLWRTGRVAAKFMECCARQLGKDLGRLLNGDNGLDDKERHDLGIRTAIWIGLIIHISHIHLKFVDYDLFVQEHAQIDREHLVPGGKHYGDTEKVSYRPLSFREVFDQISRQYRESTTSRGFCRALFTTPRSEMAGSEQLRAWAVWVAGDYDHASLA
ncbi:hypothetical protein IAT38_003885 [Cryptococcus sp. DSM 104549]